MLKDKTVDELIGLAQTWLLDGFDLCVRPGYVVNPDNAADELPRAAARCRQAGLDIPMVTGNFDLLEPSHPTAEPLLAAMDRADIRLLKLGYFTFDPEPLDYPAEVRRIRGIFVEWERMARRHRVKICYHTHSERHMGLNAAGLAALLEGFDPACLGAYLDPSHLVVEGEEFATASAMVRRYLSIVAVKDVVLERVPKNGHGSVRPTWVQAGRGMVDWTAVFGVLRSAGFAGPVSVHCELHVAPEQFMLAAREEARFFRQFVPRAGST